MSTLTPYQREKLRELMDYVTDRFQAPDSQDWPDPAWLVDEIETTLKDAA